MPFAGKLLAIVLVLATVAAIAVAVLDTGPSGPSLYAYGTSYLASDVVNSPGRRYIDQFDDALRPPRFHNLAKDGATVQQIAATVNATWTSRRAIVVIDAVTNNLYQTRADPTQGIAEAEPVFESMLKRLGPRPSIIIVKQGRLSAHDYALFDNELSDATVDAWNAMIDRVAAGRPNVEVVDPNVGWDPNTMIFNVHPTDAGEDHIAQLLFAAAGMPWRPPANA
jgi:hypothetical protein